MSVVRERGEVRYAPPAAPLARARWLLVAFAVVQRVAYGIEAGALPFVEAPLYDAAVYVRQAQAIRAGRFDDPTLVAFSPLYGWFLAIVGERWLEVQLALGVATAVLIERIGSRRSPGVGLVALALWCGYALPLFYETKRMSETLGTFLLVATLALFLGRDARPRMLVASGAVLGLAVLARANLLFAVPFFVLAAFLPRMQSEASAVRARRAAALALGVSLVLGAHGLWNLAHFGRFVPVILVSRTASVASASGQWTGSLGIFASGADGPSAWDVVRQAEVELGRRAPDAGAGGSVARGIDLGGWLASAPAKLARTFSDVETTFDYGFYGERSEMRSLAWQPISVGTLLLLGALGAFLVARAHGARAVLVHLPLVACVLVVTTLFHPSSRYRLPMILPLVLLGAEGIVELVRLPSARWRRAGLVLVALACALLGVRHLSHPLASPAMWQLRVAEGEAVRGDVEAARARLARAYALSEQGDEVRRRIDRLRAHGVLPPPPPP